MFSVLCTPLTFFNLVSGPSTFAPGLFSFSLHLSCLLTAFPRGFYSPDLQMFTENVFKSLNSAALPFPPVLLRFFLFSAVPLKFFLPIPFRFLLSRPSTVVSVLRWKREARLSVRMARITAVHGWKMCWLWSSGCLWLNRWRRWWMVYVFLFFLFLLYNEGGS